MNISILLKEGKVHVLPYTETELLFNWLKANDEVQKGIGQVNLPSFVSCYGNKEWLLSTFA